MVWRELAIEWQPVTQPSKTVNSKKRDIEFGSWFFILLLWLMHGIVTLRLTINCRQHVFIGLVFEKFHAQFL